MVIKIHKDGLLLYKSDILRIPHAMFARHGGDSIAPYSSLNCSYGVGDNVSTVRDNRRRMKKALGIQVIKGITQVHGNSILRVDSIDQATESTKNDAMITNSPGIGLLIQQADCQAVLLHDPVKHVIAAIHNGWRGSVTNIIKKTIDRMQQDFAVQASDILAVISPSLGLCCAEFLQYQQELPSDFYPFKSANNHFDFRAISKHQLKQSGIMEKNIEIAGTCTACSNNFFSYRRATKRGTGTTGRNGSIIVLPGDQ
ncbi:MAG TPA: peptidoglycan editing factor PgeF [Desulfobulbus sp.]|nr:peptidoglycan editing factor PgeF [Desulfobulbus sp.]HHD63260.1 peptidoglycan editing factor PgeF [Desulfobulbaceae bacterium]